MDTQDILYVSGMTLVGIGTACYSVAAACIVVGVMLAVPVVLHGILRTKK